MLRLSRPLFVGSALAVMVLLVGLSVMLFQPGLISAIFKSEGLPHGACYLWDPPLLTMHAGSDLLIGWSYAAISVSLGYLVYRARRTIPFHWLILCFSAFIVACGATHLFEVWTLWNPQYWISGGMKVVTAFVSLTTAIFVPPAIPRALALITSATASERRKREIEQLNAELEREVSRREGIEAALRSNQRLLEAILDNSPATIYVKDPQGRYLLLNQRAAQVLGLPAEQVLGKTDQVLRTPQIAESVRAHDVSVLAGGAALAFEETLQQDDGEHTFYSIKFPLPGPDGSAPSLCGISVDISERKRAEEALRESEERFAMIFSASPDAIGIVRQSDGVMVDVNSAWEQATGYSRAEAVGQPESQLDLWADENSRVAMVDALAIEGTAHDLDVSFRRKDGTMRAGSLSVERFEIRSEACVLEIIRDISERKRQEQALRMSEERYRTLVENFPNGVVSLYDSDLRIIVVDGAGFRGDEYTRERLLGKTLWEALPPEIVAPIEPHFRAGLDGQAGLFELDFGDNTHLIHVLPIKDPDGVVSAGLAMSQDITSQRRVEAERTARLAAERANRDKSSFLSRMSHELRTPLNAILGFGQLLEMDELEEPQRESVRYILDAGQHLLRLVDDVLDIVRVEQGSAVIASEPVLLGTAIMQAVEVVRPLAVARSITIDYELPTLTLVAANSQRLGQVILELVSNAVKYTQPGGLIRVDTALNGAGRIRVCVADNGPGISHDQLTHIFTAFERLGADSAGVEGTGLGLALARTLVEAMNGTIGVDSVPGEGSTFWVELDLATDPVTSSEDDISIPYIHASS